MFIARDRIMSSKLQRRSTDAISIGILIRTVASARWKQCSHEIGNRLNAFPVFCLAAGHRAKVEVLMRRSSLKLHYYSYERLELRPPEAADWKGSLLITFGAPDGAAHLLKPFSRRCAQAVMGLPQRPQNFVAPE
jgi:hypothetical protein